MRLTKENSDMSRIAEVKRVIRQLREITAQNVNVLLWASLPRTEWSWDARMVGLFMVAVTQLCGKKTLGGRVETCFEWPRTAEGWDVEEVKQLHHWMPYDCDLDGCRYGQTTREGWRVRASMPELQGPLGRRCMGGHGHVETCGQDAARSGFRTTSLATAVADAVLGPQSEEDKPIYAVRLRRKTTPPRVEAASSSAGPRVYVPAVPAGQEPELPRPVPELAPDGDEGAMEEEFAQKAEEPLGAERGGPQPVVAAEPPVPTGEARRRHEVSHLPYAPWCAAALLDEA